LRYDYRTLIIGSGFGGLGMGAKLKAKGDDCFLVLEKAGSLGGTWRDNIYPGAECDVHSVLYSYSFFPNPDWAHKWAKQKEILDYTQRFAEHFNLAPHIRCNTNVIAAKYEDGLWRVALESGGTLTCQFLISAVGQLHHPKIPNFKGLKTFQKPVFHTAQWDSSVEIDGKNIAVIGNAASAVQLIPKLAARAKQLTIYHRSANWVLPKNDRRINTLEKFLARHVPLFTKFNRFRAWCLGEYGLWPMIKGHKLAAALGEAAGKAYIRAHIKDESLREILTPTYPIGAKRVLLTSEYLPAVARENVEVVEGGVKAFKADKIIDINETERVHDAVIFATGFHSNPFLKSINITGSMGQSLSDKWQGSAHAYYGTMTANFPNFFILYGPNTNTGHTSIIFKLEQQIGYILKLMSAAGDGEIDIKTKAENDYNTEVQSRLATLAWSKIDDSWYKTGSRVTNNWMGSSREFKKRFTTPIWDDFKISR